MVLNTNSKTTGCDSLMIVRNGKLHSITVWQHRQWLSSPAVESFLVTCDSREKLSPWLCASVVLPRHASGWANFTSTLSSGHMSMLSSGHMSMLSSGLMSMLSSGLMSMLSSGLTSTSSSGQTETGWWSDISISTTVLLTVNTILTSQKYLACKLSLANALCEVWKLAELN